MSLAKIVVDGWDEAVPRSYPPPPQPAHIGTPAKRHWYDQEVRFYMLTGSRLFKDASFININFMSSL